MKKLTIFIVFMVMALSLALNAVPVYAVPALPHAFYGTVTINGSPAPPGTSVEARGTGVTTGIANNPTITTATGIYGTTNPFKSRLIVQGEIEEDTTITFYVNGVSTGQTATWNSGQTTELNLAATIAPGGPSEPAPISASLFGGSASFRISATGQVLQTIKATSADGELTVTIPVGTIALDKDGQPLASLTSDVDISPPSPPEIFTIIGLVYNFGPAGATFAPPITLTWTYNPDDIPGGVDPMVVEWDATANKWVEFDGDYSINPATGTITVLVSHFSKYAIVAPSPAPVAPPPVAAPPAPPPVEPAAFSLSNLSVQPREVQPGEMVTISVTVSNTGGTQGNYTVILNLNGVKEAEQSAVITAGRSQVITFLVSKSVAGSYSVTVDGLSAGFTVAAPAPPPPSPPEKKEIVTEAPAPGTNWGLIGGIFAAVVVVALALYLLVIRRRAY